MCVINITRTGQMILPRNTDDEPDVIDLTKCHAFYGLLDFPIRPPTPFADSSVWPPVILESSGKSENVIGPSLSSRKQSGLNQKNSNDDRTSTSSNRTLSPHPQSSWRKTINKLLKRTKSNEHKAVVCSTAPTLLRPYDFGTGESIRTESRCSGKRVHWIDDDEMILSLCHRFLENLKLLVENIINDKHEDTHLKECQTSLDELDELVDCQQVKRAFDDIVELGRKRNKNQLLQQQTHIETLLSRTILFSSA